MSRTSSRVDLVVDDNFLCLFFKVSLSTAAEVELKFRMNTATAKRTAPHALSEIRILLYGFPEQVF